ncbi:YIP1 family protein [Rubrobacter calidifluminis]|uniref:YIP1 family protein n=1 Tax=Rubrobacter calidifluminis TaxID=1392640 RepID=UPI002361A568|nr:YIP1 family protein [Rubrobacter calidifluminis]
MSFQTGSGGAGGAPTGREFEPSVPFSSFVETAREVLLRPVGFFRGLAREGDYLSPLLFALICYGVSTFLGGVVGLILGREGIGGLILGVVSGIVGGAVGLFIGAGIYHLLVVLMAGPQRAGYEGTFRVAAYASVTTLVSWVPLIGWILSLYGIYLSIVGIREVHSTTTGRAAAIVLIPAVVFFILAMILILLAGIALFLGSGR